MTESGDETPIILKRSNKNKLVDYNTLKTAEGSIFSRQRTRVFI